MGWIKRMKRTRLRKQKRKLIAKINKSYSNPEKLEKYLSKLGKIEAQLPTHGNSSADVNPAAARQLYTREAEMAQHEAKYAKVQEPSNPKPAPKAAYSATTPNVSAPIKPATGTSTFNSFGPSIPAGNRFAAHEQTVSKIARRAARSCATWIRNKGKWEPLNNGYSAEYDIEITVRKHGVDFNKLAYENLNTIHFSSLGMAEISEANTESFLRALKPFLDVYFPEEIDKAFSDVSPLIKRTTTVTYGKINDGWDANYNDKYRKSIIVTMRYTNPPAPKLKSW